MNRKMSCWWILLLAVVVLSRPAAADNPRVSLKVENATCAEAAAALGKAAGIPVEIYRPPQREGAPAPKPIPALKEKASFDWSNVRFAQALRQLCGRYELVARGYRGVYQLYPGGAGLPASMPEKPVGLVTRNGLRLFARGIQIYENQSRSVNFAGGPANDWGSASMSFSLSAIFDDGDAATIAGLENVVAADDLGNFMPARPQFQEYYSDFGGPSSYPDEWSGGANFDVPPPNARKLAWLEGDLMVYRTIRPVRAEVPLPLREKVVRQEVGELTFVLSRYRSGTEEMGEEDDTVVLPDQNIGPMPEPSGPRLRMQSMVPRGSRTRGRTPGSGTLPYAVGESGKIYWPEPGENTGRGNGQVVIWDYTLLFRNVPEPLVKLVWDLVEKDNPVRLCSFRMTDIPLPPAPRPAARPAGTRPVQPARPPAPGGDRPYFEREGGVLVSQVRLGERPAGEGTLSLGLAAKVDGEWSSIRWTDVEVSKEGMARLEALKPGTYRLLRRYRPKEAAPGSPAGRWQNGEVQVELTAGKETTAPPLQWLPDPAPKEPEAKKPAPPARAAPKARR
jgi:hypothetical protein